MKRTGRRDFMAGLGLGMGAGLLGPWAQQIIGEAMAAPGDAPFERFVLWADNTGWMQRYRPAQADLLTGALPDAFEPLTPWRDWLLVADEFRNPHNIGQHGNHWAFLSAVQSEQASNAQQSWDRWPNPGGVTIDRHIGERTGSATPYRSVGLGKTGGLSSDGRDEPVPGYKSAHAAYSQLFGGTLPEVDEAEIQARLARDLSVLDLVGDDLARLRGRLAGLERQKLDQYEDGLRGLERRLSVLADAQGACEHPDAPQYSGLAEDIAASIEVGVQALACRLTNVLTFNLYTGRTSFEFLGLEIDKHDLSHDQDVEALTTIDRWYAGHIATLLERLAGVPAADGSLADGTLNLWINNGGISHHNGGDHHAAVLLAAPDRYFRTGRYVSFDYGEHSMHELFLTIMHGFGIDDDHFGDPEYCHGPVDGLLA